MFNLLLYDILCTYSTASFHPPNARTPPHRIAAATTAANTSPPLCTIIRPAPAVLVAAADADEATELATLLALDMTDERLLDTEELSDDVLASALLPIPLMVEERDVVVDCMVLFAVDAQTAAVCVKVTPAGVQMPFAYARVSGREGKALAVVSQAQACVEEVRRLF